MSRQLVNRLNCQMFSFSLRSFRILVLSLALLIFVERSFLDSQITPTSTEIELTSELVASLEPRLSNPTLAGQLEVYDKLVFGKGDFLKVEGKSRRSVVLMLDKGGRQYVKLLDLPASDLNNPKLGGRLYFKGVLSKAERTSRDYVEISVTYATLSSKPGHAYSSQAEAFVRRLQELKQQNQVILAKKGEAVETSRRGVSAASPPASPQTTAAPSSAKQENAEQTKRSAGPINGRKESASKSGAPATGTPSPTISKESQESTDSEDRSEPSRNRPILRRRDRAEKESPSDGTTQSRSPATTRGGIQARDEQDVVVYRPKRKAPAVEEPLAERPAPPIISAGVKTPAAAHPSKEVDGMVLIPEGSVTLGSNELVDREKPLHRASVKAFYIDKYEVTNQEYKRFCDATGHKVPPYWKNKTYPKELEKHPVVQVNWQDALTYARWAGKRLPTEAEWERAAKGPNSYRYAYGNGYDPQKANTDTRKTTPVGSYPPNEFGLYDMTGNVNEWTSSLFEPYPYKESDGREGLQSSGTRVLRGGSNFSGENNSRCLVRMDSLPDHGTPSDGFRCARDAN